MTCPIMLELSLPCFSRQPLVGIGTHHEAPRTEAALGWSGKHVAKLVFKLIMSHNGYEVWYGTS